ncbi:hypothetical protein [Saccharothrix lopnurensis]|uniref:Uncharacterized protein n=1 Tax=Saccharothrix lopnurensis TaxID=1670621 RepID=A0ABW1P9D9_9PSEU
MLAQHLLGEKAPRLTAEAADDLLMTDAALRADAADALERVDSAERRLTATRSNTTPDSRAVEDAVREHDEAVRRLEQARALIDDLRRFVVDLDAPDGALRAAAQGWRLSPAVPAQVTVFDDEALFLTVDARRATTTGLGVFTTAGVEEWGWAWRRDDDDDDLSAPLQPDRCGRWVLGYLPATEEIYAVLRGAGVPSQVWLLGRGFDADTAHAVLDDLAPRMAWPNSLIAAAGAVHAAVLWRSHGHVRPATSTGSIVEASTDEDTRR